MQTIKREKAQIVSVPKVVSNDPFTIAFNARVSFGGRKVVPVEFPGEVAEILKNQFRIEDYIILDGFMQNGKLMVCFCTLDQNNMKGRTISYYA